MKVREIMTTNVECISPETSVESIAQKMHTLNVGFLAVCDHDRLVGTVTDRDIVMRGIAVGRDMKSAKTRDVMTHDVYWNYETDDVEDVAEAMSDKQVRRMLILNDEKRLVGVVSLGDISKVEEKESGKTLRDISEAA